MLLTFCILLGLLLLAWTLGRDLFPANLADRLSPVSLAWIGVGVWASLLLATSLFGGVTSYIYIAAGVYILARVVHMRRNWSSLWPPLLAVGIASLYSLRPVVLFDAWLYHMNAVNWSATHGIVPGLALVHYALGYVCSWFSLGASLSHGIFEQRMYILPGALALALMSWQACLCFRDLAKGKGFLSEVVFLAGFALAFAVSWKTRLIASGTPDMAVIGLSLQIMYEAARRLFGAIRFEPQEMSPLLLAAVAGFGFKLSFIVFLAPVLLGSALLVGGAGKFLIRTNAVAAAILLVCVAVSVRATGYPVYPVNLARLDLPWAMTKQEIGSTQTEILMYSRYGTQRAEGFWLPIWVKMRPGSAVLLVLSIGAVAVLTFRRQMLSRAIALPGVAGLVIFFSKAPDTRFCMGLWCSLVAVGGAVFLRSWLEKKLVGKRMFWTAGFVLWVVLSVVAALHLSSDEKAILASTRAHQQRHLPEWMIPLKPVGFTGPDARHLYPTPFERRTTPAGVDYYLVIDDPGYQGPGNCPGNYHLMATQRLTTEHLAYRKPEQGLSGGFVHSR